MILARDCPDLEPKSAFPREVYTDQSVGMGYVGFIHLSFYTKIAHIATTARGHPCCYDNSAFIQFLVHQLRQCRYGCGYKLQLIPQILGSAQESNIWQFASFSQSSGSKSWCMNWFTDGSSSQLL